MYCYGDECFFQHTDISFSKYKYTSESIEHYHSFFEIAYVSDGEGVHRIDGREYALSKGNYMIIDTTAGHSYDGNIEITNLIFRPGFLDKNFRNIKKVDELYDSIAYGSGYTISETEPVYCVFRDNGRIIDKILHIRDELEKRDFAFADCVKAELEQILIESVRQIVRENENKNGSLPVEYIEKYIYDHYDENISLSELCREIDYSLPYISRRFKAVTGVNFADYLQKTRIHFACRFFINSPELSVEDVASRVGYSDIKYFTYVFRKYAGSTPASFKRNLKKSK